MKKHEEYDKIKKVFIEKKKQAVTEIFKEMCKIIKQKINIYDSKMPHDMSKRPSREHEPLDHRSMKHKNMLELKRRRRCWIFK